MAPRQNLIRGASVSGAPAYIDAATVDRLLDYPALMAALKDAFIDPPTAPPRVSVPIAPSPGAAEGTLLVMPAVRPGGLIAVKLVTVHPALGDRPGGALRAVVVVLDAASGELRGIVDGHSLTTRRTAAASVLAAAQLARPDSRRLAILGAGAVARALGQAYATAFAIDHIAIWARRPAASEAAAAKLRALGLPAQAAPDRDAAIGGADIVSAATLSEAPLVTAARVRPGTHIDLVGGFRLAMREADDALVGRALVVVDGPQAIAEAGDIAQPLAAGLIRRGDILDLADVLRGGPPPRAPGAVTLFKSVGRALEDLAAVELLFARLDAQPKAGSRPS